MQHSCAAMAALNIQMQSCDSLSPGCRKTPEINQGPGSFSPQLLKRSNFESEILQGEKRTCAKIFISRRAMRILEVSQNLNGTIFMSPLNVAVHTLGEILKLCNPIFLDGFFFCTKGFAHN